jgi:tetratricopeptide (TPR) repeat protein
MVLVLAIASTAGWFVARESGQRLPGDSLSGGIVMSNANLLARASQLGFSDPEQAIALYTQVLDLDPDNIEALTYRGWIRALSARDMEGEQGVSTLLEAFKDLKRAVEIDPTYPDAHCFLGIVQFRYLSDAEGAKASLDLCIAANPPAQVQGFVDSIVDEVDAALASG